MTPKEKMHLNHLQISRLAGRGLALFVAVSAVLPVVAAPATRIAFPSGQVKYRMTMNGAMAMNSDVTWTWAKGGALFRQDLRGNMKMGAGAKAIQTSTWTISDGKALYTSIPSGMPGQKAMGKMAIKTTLPPGAMQSMMNMGPALAAANPSRVVGHATILGKPCEIRAITTNGRGNSTQSKVWIWQTLPLRTEITTTSKGRDAKVMKITMVATQVNPNFKPAPSLFRVPAGYRVQDMAAFQKQMGR